MEADKAFDRRARLVASERPAWDRIRAPPTRGEGIWPRRIWATNKSARVAGRSSTICAGVPRSAPSAPPASTRLKKACAPSAAVRASPPTILTTRMKKRPKPRPRPKARTKTRKKRSRKRRGRRRSGSRTLVDETKKTRPTPTAGEELPEGFSEEEADLERGCGRRRFGAAAGGRRRVSRRRDRRNSPARGGRRQAAAERGLNTAWRRV